MLKQSLLNSTGEKAGTITLPENIFARSFSPKSLSEAAVALRKNARLAKAHAKDRSERRGGGRKPWRQKGTGRARHGSIRSPIWRGGGVTHGPTKERNYQAKVNKKAKDNALSMALSEKLKDQEIIFVEDIKIESPKTKLLAPLVKKIVAKPASTLLVLTKIPTNLKRASHNLPRVGVLEAKNINLLDVLRHKYIVFTKEAIEEVIKRLS